MEGPLSENVANELSDTEEENEDEEKEDFTKIMALTTRKVHRMTDLLVNAKLGLALSDNQIWAEGLLIFYEIFRFLEEAMIRLKNVEVIARMHKILQGIERTKAFEEDLKYYYGENFLATYEIRLSVGNYLRHLQRLEEREPLRLLSYVYHLYLGLLSGGQLLQRKRDLQRKLVTVGGLIGNTIPESQRKRDAVTRFDDDGRSISELKKEIKFIMNDIARDLSKDERDSLLQEGFLVFRYNLDILQSIQGAGRITLLNILKHPLFLLLILIITFITWYFVSASTEDTQKI